MYSVKEIELPSEVASLIGLYVSDSFNNQLLIGDLHAPINKLCKAYKVVNENNQIQAGFTIYEGGNIPVVIFPYGMVEHWELIRQKINELQYPQLQLVYPIGKDDQHPSMYPAPWLGWDEYNWKFNFLDYSMRFAKEELEIMDITSLPTIRAATMDDVPAIKQLLQEEPKMGWFHPVQLESEMSVVAEQDGKIIAYAGTQFEAPYTVQIGNIYVTPKLRNIGLGRAITQAVTIAAIRTKRIPTLFVQEDNTHAIELYESIGFEKINRFIFYLGSKK